jgi:hypothetical protein
LTSGLDASREGSRVAIPTPHRLRTLLERRRAGLRDGVILLARSTTYTDRANDLPFALERDSAGEDHDSAAV